MTNKNKQRPIRRFWLRQNDDPWWAGQNDDPWWAGQNDDFSGGCAQNDNLWWLRQNDEQKQTKANTGILRCAQNDDSWGCARMTTPGAAPE
jgi:hypothetical protein